MFKQAQECAYMSTSDQYKSLQATALQNINTQKSYPYKKSILKYNINILILKTNRYTFCLLLYVLDIY